jgi:hypothetical protein
LIIFSTVPGFVVFAVDMAVPFRFKSELRGYR